MNGYNFTERVRKVLQMAREEAARLHHEYVGTEHILLGLIREGEGVAAAVLTNLNIDFLEVRQTIEGITKKEKSAAAVGPDLPYTSGAKKVLECSMSEARELKHSYVGTEHLLLGLLREKVGNAAQVLTDAGASLELVRAETLRLLGTEESRPPSRKHPSHREGLSDAYEFPLELRQSLQGARDEANRLGSDHVDAVHIALAILRMKDSAAVAVLTALDVDSNALRGNLEEKVGNRGAKEVANRDLPYTNQAENVLGLATAEVRELHHSEVGSEHLLLALLREGVFDLPNIPLSDVRMKVVELSVNRVKRQASRDSKFRLVVQSSTIRLLGVCGGLLIIEFWLSDLRQ